jgi:ribose/xylose/arabinose/galactoside ABC-type transport system permease subunit
VSRLLVEFTAKGREVNTLAGTSGKSSTVSKIAVKYGLLIVLAVLSFVSDSFFTATNLINILRQISVNGILALGMTMIIIAGGIDLSIGSLVAVGGVVSGSIILAHPNSVFLAVMAGILACGAFGLLNGIMVKQFNIPGFIATLACMTIARGFALVYSDGRPYVLYSDTFKSIGQGYIGFIPVPVCILILLVSLTAVILYLTRFGRYVYAVGGNANAAKASGVNVGFILLMVYTVNGLFAGLAGVILASRISSGQPAIGVGYELDAIAAVVIGGGSLKGGIGKVLGTVLGFLIIGVINNGLNLLNVSSYYQQIVKGVIIAGAVILDQTSKKQS